GYKAKGKRISNFEIESITELEPIRFPEPKEEIPEIVEEDHPDEETPQQVVEQGNLFELEDVNEIPEE
ncbi:MAG: hypothetical protein K2J48_07930, partial [Muribaculaceae bacterium]|nr:hypothetical protein [Muribaculaceae bacterium]